MQYTQQNQKRHHIVISKLSSPCNPIYHEIISATTSGADPTTTQNHASPLEFPNKKHVNTDKNQHYSCWLAFIPSFHHHHCNCNGQSQTATSSLGNGNDTPITAKADTDTDTDTDTAAVQRLLSHLGHVKEQMGSLAHIVSEMKQQSTLGIRTTPENEFRRASRNVHVNPFEFLSIDLDGNPLISRSALKLANMDALVDFCLCCCTCPVESSAKPNRNSSDNNDNDNNDNNFLFVDLCGAPGGFSQYILFRRLKHQQQQQQQQQRATDTETNAESDTLVQHPIGYGMSLGGENCDGRGIEWDKTLERGKEQPFKVHFGSDGTGDIYNWDNVLSLQHTISKDWNRRSRVDLVVADGGFDAQRDCEDQEGLATNLVICQVAAAFQLLERGGNFVLKMFGFQSLAMRYVMETLVEQFETVKIVKPIASRPASAERYVIAMGFRQCGKWNHHDDDAAATRDLDALTQWAFEWRRDGLLMGEQQRRGRKNVQELEEETTNRSVLDQSLDRFDWDMASLNMDACEKILHCLQEQQERFMMHGSRKKKKVKIKHTVVVDKPNIDVEHIRKLWNL